MQHAARTMHTIPAARRFLPRRHFYIGVSLLMSAIAIVGFWPAYFGPLLGGTLRQAPLLRVHSLTFTGWLVLFLVQTLFAVTGRLAWHRLLGKIGIAYGVFLIVDGLSLAVITSAALPLQGAAERHLFAPLADMAVFTSFFAAAIVYRRRSQLHERLMMVAASMLLIAAVGRMSFLPPSLIRLPLFMAIWCLPIVLGMVYDVSRGRGAHPAYLLGLGAFSVRILSTPLAGTATWGVVARWILGWVV
jgi:hypothetical protein